MIVITGGKIVTPTGILEDYDLVLEDQNIKNIIKTDENPYKITAEQFIHAKGGYVTPGFIDIHADYIEHIASPRPSSMMDFKLAIREAERELLTHGVTTMFHSLSLYKMKQSDHKPIRQGENVKRLIDVISSTHDQKHLVRHRFHARFEVDNIDNIEQLKSYIAEEKVDLLSFMDHTPGQGQFSDIEGYKRMTRQYGNQMSDDDLDAFIKERQSKEKLTMDQYKDIAQLAKKHHVAIASHDDDTIEKLEMLNEFGATISEFPITMEVAKKACEMGFHTVAGAPNVMLGGSHSGNLAAYEAIGEGVIDILCSDYYPAAMVHSIFRLHREYGHDLSEMFKLVTLNPAKAVLMDDQIGSIEVGKRGDILIIETIDDDFPVVTSCFVDGKHVFQTNYRV